MAGVKGKSGGARPNTGGARPGAGRPRGEQTTILQARVPQHLADWVRAQGGLRAVLERTQKSPDVDGLKIALTAAAASAERLAGELPYDQAANLAPIPKPPTKVKLFCKPGKMVLVANQDFSLKAGQELELEFVTLEMVDR